MGYKVAIAGATGNVGQEMLAILAEREFPAEEVVPLASRRSQGKEVSYGDTTLKCKTLDQYDFSDTDFCLMSAGGSISQEWSPKIGAQNCMVIDNSSAWRYDPECPLVVPEVNAHVLDDYLAQNERKNIIAVLQEIANRIEAQVRKSDVAARYGGEEFVILLPDTDTDSAVILAERIRSAVPPRPPAEHTAVDATCS